MLITLLKDKKLYVMDYSGLYCQCFRNTSKIQTVEIVSVYHKRLKVLFAMQPLLLLSMRFKAGFPPLVLLVQRNLKKEPILVNRKFKEHELLYCFSSFRQTVLLQSFLYMWRVGEPVLLTSPLPNCLWSKSRLVFTYFVHIHDVIRRQVLSGHQTQNQEHREPNDQVFTITLWGQ